MLRVGLTGGIGSGKSAVSRTFAGLGAAVVDADLLAREVVGPGTEGLAAVVGEFGEQVLVPTGALDRPVLGRLVFGDPDRLARLNALLHPRIAALTAARVEQARARRSQVLVHDVPLLAENGLAPSYHLVVVVRAPLEVRLDRLVRLRRMPEPEARARMAAQAGDDERARVADVLLDNGGALAELQHAVRRQWEERLVPYAGNVAAGRPAGRGPVVLVPSDPGWPAAGERLTARLRRLCGEAAVAVDHVGSTAVPGLAARDVVDLQVQVPSAAAAQELAAVLGAGGFPVRPPDRPGGDEDPAERLHLSADPGRPADVHLRPAGSAAARAALALRDLLRSDGEARSRYEDGKRRLAVLHPTEAAYADAKAAVLRPLLSRALAG